MLFCRMHSIAQGIADGVGEWESGKALAENEKHIFMIHLAKDFLRNSFSRVAAFLGARWNRFKLIGVSWGKRFSLLINRAERKIFFVVLTSLPITSWKKSIFLFVHRFFFLFMNQKKKRKKENLMKLLSVNLI